MASLISSSSITMLVLIILLLFKKNVYDFYNHVHIQSLSK
ncbi:uncharacterized protein Dvar_79480 [Desulfosarcina variabilis str. Montpellier]